MKNVPDGSRDSSKVRMIDVMCKAFLAWLHMAWGLTVQLFHNAYIYIPTANGALVRASICLRPLITTPPYI
jgi:hypothetical protein